MVLCRQGALIEHLIAFKLPERHQFPFQHPNSILLMMSCCLAPAAMFTVYYTNVHKSGSSCPGNVMRYKDFRVAKPMKGGLMPFLIFFFFFLLTGSIWALPWLIKCALLPTILLLLVWIELQSLWKGCVSPAFVSLTVLEIQRLCDWRK